MKSRGVSIVELLISTFIILILLLAVCNAVIGMLHAQAFQADRASTGRTAGQLSERLVEEARSSTAVFIPISDVFGNPNSGSAGSHEVDFFRRMSYGGDAYVAYRFDSSADTISRYEYTLVGGLVKVGNVDLAATGVSSFSAIRERIADTGAVGASDASAVSILYGRSEVVGGNDVVVVSMQTKGGNGVPGRPIVSHLASRSAPTALSVLAPSGSPTKPPGKVVTPFVLLRPGFPLHLPHGPWHIGDPGGGGGSSDSGVHWVAATGTADFYGGGITGNTWFELSGIYSRIDSGVFTFTTSDGSTITAAISCAEGPCPAFRPLPVSAPDFTSGGLVAFQVAR